MYSSDLLSITEPATFQLPEILTSAMMLLSRKGGKHSLGAVASLFAENPVRKSVQVSKDHYLKYKTGGCYLAQTINEPPNQ